MRLAARFFFGVFFFSFADVFFLGQSTTFEFTRRHLWEKARVGVENVCIIILHIHACTLTARLENDGWNMIHFLLGTR